MLFNSLQFLVFFPTVLLFYYVLPQRIRYIWLLISSYYFYMCWNAEYALLILASTLITYCSGLLLDKAKKEENQNKKQRNMKCIVAASFILNLAILFYFKYTNFILSVAEVALSWFGIKLNIVQFDIILPVGISFYTFQALSYTVDVYRDEIYAEKNVLRYALFVSFFPQLVAGPIERSKNLLRQLALKSRFSFEAVREGFFLMLWGYFLKIVLADRIAVFVDTVYGDYAHFEGYYLVVATVLFAVQIYCDFAGYSTIAMGAARMLGINLMENFNAPYLSTSVGEFWRNWHISLTSWFKDYLYIPLGGSRKGVVRKSVNKMIVFLVSGLWHGASITFIVWGGLNGLYQIVGEAIMPVRDRVVRLLRLNRESFGHKLAGVLATFILVDFSWIFFRAASINDALLIIKSMFSGSNPWILFDGSLYNCGLDIKNYWVMIFGMAILLFADVAKRKKFSISSFVFRQDYWFRWIFIDFVVVILLIFGVWGSTYDASNFIYFQF